MMTSNLKVKFYFFFLLINGIGFSQQKFSSNTFRLKDIAEIKEEKEIALTGIGIVIGLNGTGDSPQEIAHHSLAHLSLKNMIEDFSVKGGQDVNSQTKNAAAVTVTAKLSSTNKRGDRVNVEVSSIGDATSLEGGELIPIALEAKDKQVYATALGRITKDEKIPTSSQIIQGATVEKDVGVHFSQKRNFKFLLFREDFSTAAWVAQSINQELGVFCAKANDQKTIEVEVPLQYQGKGVELVARLGEIRVPLDCKKGISVDENSALIVMDPSIPVLKPFIISLGDLSIEIQVGAKISALNDILNRIGINSKKRITIFRALPVPVNLVKIC